MIRKYFKNIFGWSTFRKIVIIESDDWGSIRMNPKERSSLLSKGFDVFDRYNTFDSLESSDDLNKLFDVLAKHTDKNGKHPVFTAVSVVANPDFDRIRSSNFHEYHYKSFVDSYADYYSNPSILKLWSVGRDNGLFVPQFHGREHLNVKEWMRSLQNADSPYRVAFDHGVWACSDNKSNNSNVDLLAAFDLQDKTDISYHEIVIKSGLQLFKDIHGFDATLFVPPNGPFTSSLEKVAADNGIKFISTAKLHRDPPSLSNKIPSFRWLGKRNAYMQRYITRNSYFEPSVSGIDWVDSCLSDISIAFKFFKPAIISSHRVNYIGTLDKSNQSNGLLKLDHLLKSITKQWPDVEFMSSAELGDLINSTPSFKYYA